MKHLFTAPLLLLLAVCLPLTTRAQGVAPDWQSVVNLPGTAGSGTVSASCMTTDAAGNVYVGGSFSGTVRVGTTLLTSVGASDVFVAKWNGASFDWVQQAGGPDNENINSLAVGPQGVYLTGFFSSAGAAFGATTITGAGSLDGFVAKISQSGTTAGFAWARSLGGAGLDAANAVAVAGNTVYVSGSFSLSLPYGGRTYVSAGGSDIFLAALTDLGTTSSPAWLTNLGGSGDDSGGGVAVSGGSVYLTGWFVNSMVVGTTGLFSAGGSDVFITKFTDIGTAARPIWTRQAESGPGQSQAAAVAVEGSSVYLTGAFAGTTDFGPASLTSAGRGDAFVARLTDAGATADFAWAQRLGGPNDDVSFTVVPRLGAVYVAGRFEETASGLGTAVLTSAGRTDAFVARLTDTGPTATVAWVQQAGGPGFDQAVGVGVTATGSVYVCGTVQPPASFGPLVIRPDNSFQNGYLATLPAAGPTATRAAVLPLPMYPNPAHTRVQVPAATASTVLTLYNGLGKVVRTTTGPQLSVAGLAPGLYVLQAATPGQPLRTGKLLVE